MALRQRNFPRRGLAGRTAFSPMQSAGPPDQKPRRLKRLKERGSAPSLRARARTRQSSWVCRRESFFVQHLFSLSVMLPPVPLRAKYFLKCLCLVTTVRLRPMGDVIYAIFQGILRISPVDKFQIVYHAPDAQNPYAAGLKWPFPVLLTGQ